MSKNISAYIKPAYIGYGNLVAGATGDATLVSGKIIDRQGFDSAELEIGYSATLASGKHLAVKVNIQDSDTNFTTTLGTEVNLLATTNIATGPSGGGTVTGVYSIPLNLAKYKRYIAINVVPDLDATGTDTSDWHGIAVLGDADTLPV